MPELIPTALFACSLGSIALSWNASVLGPAWPEPRTTEIVAAAPHDEIDENGVDGDRDRIEAQTVCIARESYAAGELGRSVLYRYKRAAGRVEVGYFVYWSTERPWGKNALSYTLVPALFTDAVYSHFFFVLPGMQRAIYGAGDVEGMRVTFEERPDGSLSPLSAVADDERHHEVKLAAVDFVDQKGRLVFMTNSWSHQLGAPGAAASEGAGDGAVQCFGGQTLRPLTARVASLFRLGVPNDPKRARPAWVR